jgi:hypothetical protein
MALGPRRVSVLPVIVPGSRPRDPFFGGGRLDCITGSGFREPVKGRFRLARQPGRARAGGAVTPSELKALTVAWDKADDHWEEPQRFLADEFGT